MTILIKNQILKHISEVDKRVHIIKILSDISIEIPSCHIKIKDGYYFYQGDREYICWNNCIPIVIPKNTLYCDSDGLPKNLPIDTNILLDDQIIKIQIPKNGLITKNNIPLEESTSENITVDFSFTNSAFYARFFEND